MSRTMNKEESLTLISKRGCVNMLCMDCWFKFAKPCLLYSVDSRYDSMQQMNERTKNYAKEMLLDTLEKELQLL